MPTVRTRRLTVAALIACGVAAAACACTSGTTNSAAASSTARTPAAPGSSPGPSASAAAAALAAYEAMWKDVAEASNTADYQAAYLSDHLAGQALLTITDNMATEKAQGIAAHGAPVLHPVVTSVSAESVTVSDCDDDRAWIQVVASTGKPVNDTPGGFRATTATVTDENGIWKVTQLNSGADGTCHLSQ